MDRDDVEQIAEVVHHRGEPAVPHAMEADVGTEHGGERVRRANRRARVITSDR